LPKGPADLATLSQTLGLHARSARDFLDALVALKLIDRQDGRYSNTPETDLYLDRGKPSYVGGLLEMANARLYSNWGLLTEALKTGRNQNEFKVPGDVFGALYASMAARREEVTPMKTGREALRLPWWKRHSERA
jgi:methyltransferase family protein